MSLFAVLTLLIFVGVVIAVVRFLAKRKTGGAPSGGNELIAYGLLAISAAATVWSLAMLAEAAFPADRFAGDPGEQVATALATLVVAAPIAVILWRRQAQHRETHPEVSGWPLYLAFAEAVFTTALLVTVIDLVITLVDGGQGAPWIRVVILAGVFAFHEWAAAQDPPGGDIAELPRTVGSAIGLIALASGAGGLLWELFEYLYGTIAATAGSVDLATPTTALVLGAGLWSHRWLREWPDEPAMPRKTYYVLATTLPLSTIVGSAIAIAVGVIAYFLGDIDSAAEHFEYLPGSLAVLIVAWAAWAHHRRRIGPERDNVLRTYEYIMSALGLAFGIGGITALAAVAFSDAAAIGSDRPQAVLSLGILALSAAGVWLWFWNKCQTADRAEESVTTPRKVYVTGMAIVAGLTAAQALIAVLVVAFQAAFGLDPSQTTLVAEGALVVLAGAATWHLWLVGKADRGMIETTDVITPFDVVVICSHPGTIATLFPKEAKLRIVYRGDEAGVVTDDLAHQIIDAVGTSSTLVWVEESGFRTAPMRTS